MTNTTYAATHQRVPATGMIYLLICAICWGAGVPLTKDILAYLPPITLLTVQLLISSLVLWIINLKTGTLRQFKPHHLKHGLPGLLEPGAVFVLGLVGLSYTSATNAVLIGAVEPLLLVGLCWLFLREKVQHHTLRLMGIAVLGTLIVGLSDAGGGGTASLHGNLLIVGATVCAALYTLASRQSITRVPPLLLAALQQTCALIGVLALLPFQPMLAPMPLAIAPASAWLLAIFTGIMEFALPYLLYLYAIRRVTTAQAALFPMVVPIFGIAAAVLLLGEPLSSGQLIGAVFVLGASAAIHFHPSHPTDSDAAENEAYNERLDYVEAL
jgi:drug/metabolite transporter (DMT)-like permease